MEVEVMMMMRMMLLLSPMAAVELMSKLVEEACR